MRPAAFWTCLLCIVCCTGCPLLCPTAPSSADDVRADWSGIGNYRFHRQGDDSSAWMLVRNCGCNVFEGHTGGAGDTLQIVDPGGSLVLIWAYNQFNGFVLREGWSGQTGRGAQLGMTRADFIDLYPEFTETSSEDLYFQSGTTWVTVSFDDGLLSELDVRDY